MARGVAFGRPSNLGEDQKEIAGDLVKKRLFPLLRSQNIQRSSINHLSLSRRKIDLLDPPSSSQPLIPCRPGDALLPAAASGIHHQIGQIFRLQSVPYGLISFPRPDSHHLIVSCSRNLWHHRGVSPRRIHTG